jgi:transcriptional regulator with XRE-family HTH domain
LTPHPSSPVPPHSLPAASPDQGLVLSKAVVRAARRLEVSQARLGEVLGVSGPTVSRLVSGKYVLDPGRQKEWELAALFVRLYRSLNSIVATDENARAWLDGRNHALGGRPIDLITRAEGLVRVLHYLDASRARS